MQLNLNTFHENISTQARIEESIASNLTMKGLKKVKGLSEILEDIFVHYDLDNGVFRLRDESCSKCRKKLKRKGIYKKEILLPGGVGLFLSFHQYSCPHCKEKVGRKLGSWFCKGERYSSNIKSDALRFYLSHLSSYEAVKHELDIIYKRNFSKRTIRKWLKSVSSLASQHLDDETDFSGHFVYDEEYMKIFIGDVGKKGSTLQRIEVYLLLFRDAVTGNVKLTLSDSLDKSKLIHPWREFIEWAVSKRIPLLTFTTDGKREYNTLIDELNKEYDLDIKHSYCVFHFKKNLYEVSNKYEFGGMRTKNSLPDYIINQIQTVEKAMDSPTAEEFDKCLKQLLYEIQTFIPPLRDQIKRMKKYARNYKLHKEFPFLRTTNTCERWFSQTKPEKVKKGYKTERGLLNVLKCLAVKMTNANWKEVLSVPRDITDATELLISSLIYKRDLKRPA